MKSARRSCEAYGRMFAGMAMAENAYAKAMEVSGRSPFFISDGRLRSYHYAGSCKGRHKAGDDVRVREWHAGGS